MATNLPSSNHAAEDYIDMEVSSSSNYLCCSTNSPPQSREFEFQMSSISNEKESTTSPADELFYKGKLLPLHLPPRLQMVQKLLQTTDSTFEKKKDVFEEEHCSINPSITSSTAPSTNTSTPLESCNISPSESCRVSGELNPEEYFFEWSTELSTGFITENTKKSWSNKLKLIKHSSLCQKLKASRAYLMSLFSKSGCSDEACAKAAGNSEAGHVSEGKDYSNSYSKATKKSPFGHMGKGTYPILADVIKSIDREGINEDNINSHRKSFSGAIKRHSPMKCLSSSSSSSDGSSSASTSSLSFNNSQGFYEVQLLKRSSSVTTETDGLIDAAIAHCKKSQELFTPRRTINEAGFFSASASRIADGRDQQRPAVVCGI